MKLKNVNKIHYNIEHRRHKLDYINGATGEISIASGVGLPVEIALGGASLLFSLITPATRKYLKASISAQGKHDSTKLLAHSKLDSIANIISQAMQDGDISPTKFRKGLQEVEKYRKLKADIRNQTKSKVKHITKEQREELLE